MVDHELIRIVRDQFGLDWRGIHGEPHWRRVCENGLHLSGLTGADFEVVELFAFLHDSRRLNDGHDPDHGRRAADFARSLAGVAFDLEAARLDCLLTACQGHADGGRVGGITVLTCWDADRLDLGRVGTRPDPRRLCTEAARDPAILERAYRASLE